jgi:hypothetical protein
MDGTMSRALALCQRRWAAVSARGMAATACSWIRGTRRAAAGQEDLGSGEDRAASGGVREKKNTRNTETSGQHKNRPRD